MDPETSDLTKPHPEQQGQFKSFEFPVPEIPKIVGGLLLLQAVLEAERGHKIRALAYGSTAVWLINR